MLPRLFRVGFVLCLFALLQLVASQGLQVARRQDDASPSTTIIEDSQSTALDNGENAATTIASAAAETDATQSGTRTASITKSPTANATATPTTTATTSLGSFNNSTFLNVTIPDGQLPIQPEVTPGWGVAGVVLLITGIMYTLIGIKNRFVHTFFSTAFSTGLGVSVLIVYVMHPPVEEAIQGAYVAAAVLSGCLLGGISIFFKELTEGLGCALGGFCVSMWLLCLVPGGLLGSVTAKAILISCFTVVAFAFYFSRFTRDWALITMISFGGATVTVLGIDCFSRAGLKEFWAYVWQLNDDLFPLGVHTYPVTKGIRVETAAVIIIFLFGIVSQIKLWKVVREQREKKTAAREEAQRALDEEEGNMGRQVEVENARERRQWERVYGGGEGESSTQSRDSGLVDPLSEKGLRRSRAESSKPRPSVEAIEMAEMSESGRPHSGPVHLMAAEDAEDGKVTVRVATDDTVAASEEDDEFINEKHGKAVASARNSKSIEVDSQRASAIPQVTEAPEVVPLPFKVTKDDTSMSQGDRSSIATFADEEGAIATPTGGKRQSLRKRISQGSISMLRGFSQRSPYSSNEPPHDERGESTEDLVVSRHQRDASRSVAATMDLDSLSASSRRASLADDQQIHNIEIKPELSDNNTQCRPAIPQGGGELDQPAGEVRKDRHFSTATVSTSILGKQDAAENTKQKTGDSATVAIEEEEHEGSILPASEKPKSIISASSTPVSLTKDRLPQSLSRVAMSYRTNEWAKHLSHAETPEPDELHVAAPRQSVKIGKEKAAPVDVKDLQKTASDGLPSVKRSESIASTTVETAKVSKNRNSSASSITQAVQSEGEPAPRPHDGTGLRVVSPSHAFRATSSAFEPIVEEQNAAQDVGVPAPQGSDSPPAVASPVSEAGQSTRAPVAGVVSYDSPQTLIGQRELVMRSKSQGNLFKTLSENTVGVDHYQGSPSAARTSSDGDSIYNYPAYASALGADADDVPLNQRKQMMRQGSAMSLGQNAPITPSASNPNLHHSSSAYGLSETGQSESYLQSRRISAVPHPAVREAQLANFRQSVASDLRSGSPMVNPMGRETPFASTSNLLSNERDREVSRNIERQRSMLIRQKEADAQRREVQQRERQWTDRAFDERMRSGHLQEAHREAMRKMQRGANKS